jgi:hypothetical protein
MTSARVEIHVGSSLPSIFGSYIHDNVDILFFIYLNLHRLEPLSTLDNLCGMILQIQEILDCLTMQLHAAQVDLRFCCQDSIFFKFRNGSEDVSNRSRNDTSLTFCDIKGLEGNIVVATRHDSLHRISFSCSSLSIREDRDFLTIDDRADDSLNLIEDTLLGRFSIENLVEGEVLWQ